MENVWDYLRAITLRWRLEQLRRDPAGLRRCLELVHRRSRPHPIIRNKSLGNGQCLGRLVYTEMMNLHLSEISTQVAQGAIAVLTCDGAGWHQPGGALIVPDNIALLHLPPYSPN